MKSDQLYYPYVNPDITPKLCLSLLHWDAVFRIMPMKGSYRFDNMGSLQDKLAESGLLKSLEVNLSLVDEAGDLFHRIMLKTTSDNEEIARLARSLVTPFGKRSLNGTVIFEGKTFKNLHKEYPKYFLELTDHEGYEGYPCSKRTAYTYMTILAYLINKDEPFANTITDDDEEHPLFLSLCNVSEIESESLDKELISPQSEAVEWAYYVPLYDVLEPVLNDGAIIDKIIRLRQDKDAEDARKRYLQRIRRFILDLRSRTSDDEVKELVSSEISRVNEDFKRMADHCGLYNVPIAKGFVMSDDPSKWTVVKECWDRIDDASTLIAEPGLGALKLGTRKMLDKKLAYEFQNKIMKTSDLYYPLLVQQNLNPTTMGKIHQRAKQLGELNIF